MSFQPYFQKQTHQQSIHILFFQRLIFIADPEKSLLCVKLVKINFMSLGHFFVRDDFEVNNID